MTFMESTDVLSGQHGELVALRRMLAISRGCFSLSVAVCNSQKLREYVIDNVCKLAPDVAVARVPAGTIDVFNAVTIANPAAVQVDALFVIGIEDSIDSAAEHRPTIRSLNASRELWEQAYHCPVIFWLPEYAATLLTRYAPDLWRYRSHQFEFVSEHATAAAGRLDTSAGDLKAAENRSAAEKRFRIAELEQRLSGAGKNPLPELTIHVAVWAYELGYLYHLRRQWEPAITYYMMSTGLSEKSGNHHGQAANYHQLGLTAEARGKGAEAEQWYRRSLEIRERLGHEREAALTYHQLGNLRLQRGEHDVAETWYRRSLDILEHLNDEGNASRGYGQLGMLAQERRRWADAEHWYGKALEIDERVGDGLATAITYHQLGSLAVARGDVMVAERMFLQSLEISERLDLVGVKASLYEVLASLSFSTSRFQDAGAYLAKARAAANNPEGVSFSGFTERAFVQAQDEDAHNLRDNVYRNENQLKNSQDPKFGSEG